MKKHILFVVVFVAGTVCNPVHAAHSLFSNSERQLLRSWANAHYRPLSAQGKKILDSACRANLQMLQACKESLQHEGGINLLSQEAFLRMLKLWTHSSELVKEQAPVEVIDVVRAVNALNQLRLDWLRKVVERYQKKKPNIIERIIVRFTQRGRFRLYRDLNTLVKWSNEIVEQFMLFEDEMLKLL